jgi:hypothetical protein
MSDPVLATATVAVPDPLDVRPLAQPALAAIPADNDNKIVAVDPPATPAPGMAKHPSRLHCVPPGPRAHYSRLCSRGRMDRRRRLGGIPDILVVV